MFRILLAFLTVAIGFVGSQLWFRQQRETNRKELRAFIATIRTYEEAYFLKNGHYLLLADSCSPNAVTTWGQLGLKAPSRELGCFRVSATTAGEEHAAPITSPTMFIIGISPDQSLKGVESQEDSQPTWANLKE